ncbi:hypothetical protein BGX28_004925 [Mortierella sp. GBA30]|nr:hypothetical protein BGX28_004925 [Mortierella sp. GBA30]
MVDFDSVETVLTASHSVAVQIVPLHKRVHSSTRCLKNSPRNRFTQGMEIADQDGVWDQDYHAAIGQDIGQAQDKELLRDQNTRHEIQHGIDLKIGLEEEEEEEEEEDGTLQVILESHRPTKHHSRNFSKCHPQYDLCLQQQGHYEDSQFPVQPLDRFKVKCAPFRQPIEIGSFSYDEKRNFIMDDSQLKYYFPPDLTTPNNLSVNYEKYIARDSNVDEHIDALLDALIGIRDRELREQQEKREEESERQDQRSDTRATMTMTQADFVCYRGILTKIMCTPYTRNEPWELGATLYKGSIYIEEHVSAENRKNATGTNERHKLMSYWGYRFETICNISKPVSELRRIKIKKRRASDGTTQEEQDSKQEQDQEHVEGQEQDKRRTQENVDRGSNNKNRKLDDGTAVAQEQPLSAESKWCSNDKDAIVGSSTGDPEADDVATGSEMMEQIDFLDPELTGRLDGIVNTNLQYCTVARTKIGRNSIIMGAEVDCTSEPKKPAPHNPLSNYIELKTSRIISNAREQNNFERHKLLKFWAQSFLPGIPTIIVGFRDDDGNVVTVKTFKTMEIPRLVRGKDGAWDTTICINFLDSFLNFLRKVIVVDDPEATYTIRWAYPFRAIEVEFADKRNMFLTERFLKRWSA